MKKITLVLAVLALVLCLFAGCGRAEETVPDDTNVSTTDNGKVNGDNDTTESAGDMIEDAADATGDMIDDAAQGAEAALDPADRQPRPDGTDRTPDNEPTDRAPDTARRNRRIIRGTGTPDMVTGEKTTGSAPAATDR